MSDATTTETPVDPTLTDTAEAAEVDESAEVFVPYGGQPVARALLDAADEEGIDQTVVRSVTGGYYVPKKVADRYQKDFGSQAQTADLEGNLVGGEQEAASEPNGTWKNEDIEEYASKQNPPVDLSSAKNKPERLQLLADAKAAANSGS